VSDVEVQRSSAHVTTIRLNRPGRLNALTFDLVAELHSALDEVAADDDCRVVVLRGAGRGFCSGLDLKGWGSPPAVGAHPRMRAGMDAQTFMSDVIPHIRETPQVVVAAVSGPAFGGGLALACAADLRLADETARFCSAFIRTGLSGTDIGITYLLPRLVGAAPAFDLILTGREIDAAEALRIGLVSRVAPAGEIDALVAEYTDRLVDYTTVGLRTTKDVLWHNLDAPSLAAALAVEIRNQNLMAHEPEVRQYMADYASRTTGRRTD